MNMIIGVDYHPSVQQIAFVEKETGEYGERQLNHSDGEAEKFYRDLKQRGVGVRVGMEPPGIPAGSSGSWLNSVSSYGSEIQRRLRRRESGNRRPTARMLDIS